MTNTGAVCRGCGKRIVWGITDDGKKIPLDPTPPVYEFTPLVGETLNGLKVRRAATAYVSHFSTCPDANRFSGSKKKQEGKT